MRGIFAGLIVLALAPAPAPAQALCIYNGVDNAKTTIAQEFRDSRWVVRAHIVAATYHWVDEDTGSDESWVSYRLKVVETFKGRLPPRFTFFSERNSGGFYMDADGATPDVDHDYLLFLVPNPRARSGPAIARNALWVNYNCGQSKSWSEVTAADTAELRRLARWR